MKARLISLAALAVLASAGCRATSPPEPPPPKVSVSRPVARDVVEWDEYTGRLEAVETVEVRARVGGYLQSVDFYDGAMVRKGDLLFVIDPRPYVAALHQAEGDLELARSRLDLAKKELVRAEKLVQRRAISVEELDTRAAARREAAAQLQAAHAAVEARALDVEFTRVTAPVPGRLSRAFVDPGNLVVGGAGQATLLTTIVSLDPIHCYIEADEQAYLKYTRLAAAGDRLSSREYQTPVQVGLADEEGFPHQGHMDFIDNRLDSDTGTMVGRAILPNPDLLFSPGLFVRLRLPGSGRYPALLLPDEAIGTDQSQKFVYVVNDENEVEHRAVKPGPMIDGLRVVREGVGPDDRVITAGIQRARPGIKVEADEKPSGGEVAADSRTPARQR